jgi:prolyl-tRNA synthetase
VALAFPVEGGEVTYGTIGSHWQEQSLLQAPVSPNEAAPLPLEKVHTPGASTIAELATFLDISPRQTAKVVLYTQAHAEPALVMVVVRGDHSVNEVAVRRQLGVADLRVATEVDMLAAGAVPGYASPIGLDQRKLRVLIDAWVAESPNLAAGANEAGYHFRNSNYGRDYEGGEVGRFALVEPEQLADQGWHQAVEVARYLPIGSDWSAQSDITVMSQQGKPEPLAFGYVRVDLSQLLLVAAARHQDEQGLCWPDSLSPFSLQLLSLADGEASIQTAEKLYAALSAAGYRVLYDDRSKKMAGPGVKFKDADLRGIPLRITVAKKALAQGGVEWKWRSSSEREIVPLGEVLDRLAADL